MSAFEKRSCSLPRFGKVGVGHRPIFTESPARNHHCGASRPDQDRCYVRPRLPWFTPLVQLCGRLKKVEIARHEIATWEACVGDGHNASGEGAM